MDNKQVELNRIITAQNVVDAWKFFADDKVCFWTYESMIAKTKSEWENKMRDNEDTVSVRYLTQVIRDFINASYAFHDPDDCKVEGRASECSMCKAIKKYKVLLD
jgi:hypothetical protein